MHTSDSKDSLIAEVAKAADLSMKPYVHSVFLENQLFDNNDFDDFGFLKFNVEI